MVRQKAKILSAREVQVMNAVWKLGKGSVKEIRVEMGEDRTGAYTSVATMLRFLETKGVVDHERKGRIFYYFPKTAKEDEQQKAVTFVVSSYFGGDVKALEKTLKNLFPTERDEYEIIGDAMTSKNL